MKRCLTLLFSLWIAVTLVITPMGAAHASACPGEMSASTAAVTVHRTSDAETGAATSTHHDSSKMSGAHAPMIIHGCCASSCVGMALPASPHGVVLTMTDGGAPVRLSERLPEGITTAPLLVPPIVAI